MKVKRDIKYIIKRVLIIVLSSIILFSLKKCNVSAEGIDTINFNVMDYTYTTNDHLLDKISYTDSIINIYTLGNYPYFVLKNNNDNTYIIYMLSNIRNLGYDPEDLLFVNFKTRETSPNYTMYLDFGSHGSTWNYEYNVMTRVFAVSKSETSAEFVSNLFKNYNINGFITDFNYNNNNGNYFVKPQTCTTEGVICFQPQMKFKNSYQTYLDNNYSIVYSTFDIYIDSNKVVDNDSFQNLWQQTINNGGNSFVDGSFTNGGVGQNNIEDKISFIKLPFELLHSITNDSCVPINLPLPFINTEVSLPCMSTIINNVFGDAYDYISFIVSLIVTYKVTVLNIMCFVDVILPTIALGQDKLEAVDL